MNEEKRVISIAEGIEALAVIALIFGIISLGLAGRSDVLQKELAEVDKINSEIPHATDSPHLDITHVKEELETQIHTLNTVAMVFKVLDIALVLFLVIYNAKEIAQAFKVLKDISLSSIGSNSSWFSRVFG